MSIGAMAGRRMTLTRRTAELKSSGSLSPITANIAPDRQPFRPAHVEITVSGATTFGSLTVNGTVDGVGDSEVLTWTANNTKITVKRFDSITDFFRTGWDGLGASFVALAVGADGSRRQMQYTVATGIRVRLDRARGSWISPEAGRNEFEKTRAYIDYTTAFTPREGDVLTDEVSGLEFEVHTDPDLFGGGSAIPHHWELEVRQRRQSTTT